MVETGQLAGRYRLDEEIATGGMGTVYRATDERLGRSVAVKLLKPELAQDARFVERFRREARSAAALSHPHIANVFDYGEDAGRHFIVMELAPGRDLARLLREEGPLPPDRTVHIAAQICEALAHAHAAGVVHRDVKPANVMVAPDDRVKVTDFGIARAAGAATLTATGTILGSANYLSPEQARGGPVGPRSDLYSLGIVVFEMLTGSVPFTGDSPVAVATRHLSDDVPPPSGLKPGVPPELDEVVIRATAKAPGDRFADAGEMAGALLAAARPTDVMAVPGPAAAGAGATAVLDATAEDRGMWLLEGTRWDPYKVGRNALIVLAALALVAAVLLAARLATRPEEPERGATRREQTRGQERPASSFVVVPEEIIGSNVDAAKEVLEQQGLKVEDEKVDPNVFGFEDAPKDVVVGSEPDPGSRVRRGATIRLFVSEGPDEGDDDEGEGDGEDDGPGKSEGKGHGKGHGKVKD